MVFAATSSVSELPHRLPSYAALAGMLAAKDAELAQQLVDGVAAAFAQRLEKLDTIPAKLLVSAAASVVARGMHATTAAGADRGRCHVRRPCSFDSWESWRESVL